MQMSLEDRRSLISVRVQMLVTLFNKRVSEETLESVVRVFCDGLEHFPQEAITKGFGKAEQELDRFPTPRILREICGEFLPSQIWRYDFRPADGVDGETGARVSILLDPDPTCAECREPRSVHPTKKCAHAKASGLGRDFEMFKPQHCQEGRAFLNAMRNIAGKS